MLGHLIPLSRHPLDLLASLSGCGDVAEIRLGPHRAYVACRPDSAKEVLFNPRTFDKGGPLIETSRLLVGNGLASCSWDEHRGQRRLLQPLFHPVHIAAYAPVMRDEMESITASWAPGRTVDISAEMYAYAVKVAARTLCAGPLGADAVAEIQHALPEVLRGLYWRMLVPWGLSYPGHRRFAAALGTLRRVIKDIIRIYRASPREHGDLLSLLLAHRDPQTGQGLTDRGIHDQVMTLLVAGTETSANTLAWALYHVGRDPTAESALHEEIDRVLAGTPADAAVVPRLVCTRRILTETLRLHPPVWAVTRIATTDTRLAGHLVAAGTTVVWSAHVLHRNPRLFPDPHRFAPERWLPENAATIPRGAFLPFGAGSRKCIGEAFAMTETTLALATLAARWRLRLPQGAPAPTPQPRITLGTGRLPMRCTPRRRG